MSYSLESLSLLVRYLGIEFRYSFLSFFFQCRVRAVLIFSDLAFLVVTGYVPSFCRAVFDVSFVVVRYVFRVCF